MVPKMCYLSRLNTLHNLLDQVRKKQLVIRMKVESNKGICPDFGSNVLGCMYIWSIWSANVWYIHEPSADPYPGSDLYETCPGLPGIYHMLDLKCLSQTPTSQPISTPLKNKMIHSVTFMWYLKPSYFRNTHHFGKSHIICR